jgi:hypothetical protein
MGSGRSEVSALPREPCVGRRREILGFGVSFEVPMHSSDEDGLLQHLRSDPLQALIPDTGWVHRDRADSFWYAADSLE